jgi:phosphotransferase system HPr (HPr) family protein
LIARNFQVVDQNGLHAVPAQMLVKLVKSATFAVYVEDPIAGRFSADNLLMLMSLKVHQGGHIRVIVDTPDAADAEFFFEEVQNILLPKRTN